MKTNKRFELLCWGLSGLGLVLTLALLPALPDRVPLHWNAAGQVDGWGTRLSALLLPVTTLGLNALFLVLPAIDPKRKNYAAFAKAYEAFRLIFNLFMLLMCALTLYSAFYPDSAAMEKVVPASMGALLCVLGNYMPKFKNNYFVGIKTPWTLASEAVWRSTHRLGGILWFFGGLALMATAFLLPSAVGAKVSVAIMVVIVLVPVVFSYLSFRKEQKESLAQQKDSSDMP